jgi:hypothetical protein
VLQLSELQLEHEEPPVPAIRVVAPALLLKQANVDILRRAGLWHRGQSASLSAWLKGRSCSNSAWHLEQTYSYIGISVLLINSLNLFSEAVKLEYQGFWLVAVDFRCSPPDPLSNKPKKAH